VSAPSQTATPRQAHAAEGEATSPGYANYVLFVLFVVYVFNFIDRQILSILIDPIKAELGASDTQMGFLTGFAFAVFYTVAGIPIARWADYGVRRNLIAVGLAVWSAMTALSGAAQSYWHLALARIGVGVGEAAGSPPAHSLISDYFSPEKRATAISIYNSGIHVGVMLGYLAGGWINEFFSWRVAFLVVGVPGILFALVVRFTIKEPRRGMSDAPATATARDTEHDSVKDVMRFMLSMRSFKMLSVATGIAAFSAYGFGSWVPSYLRRVHEMGSGEIGTWIGIEAGVGGALGSIWGGRLADKLGAKDKRWYLWVPALSLVAYFPFVYLFLLIDNPRIALIAYFFAITFAAMHLGPAIAVTYQLVKVRMRALASAILLFVLNMIGLGLGPLLVGMVSDALAAEYGALSIRYSLMIVAASKFIAIWMFWSASKSLVTDLDAKNRWRSSAAPA
jgi:predicted MFS family arabinose efflux permease